jgi:hypothetical protein
LQSSLYCFPLLNSLGEADVDVSHRLLFPYLYSI